MATLQSRYIADLRLSRAKATTGMSTVLLTPLPPSVRFTSLMYPEEEYHSIKETYKLLCELIDPRGR